MSAVCGFFGLISVKMFRFPRKEMSESAQTGDYSLPGLRLLQCIGLLCVKTCINPQYFSEYWKVLASREEDLSGIWNILLCSCDHS